jgi:Ca2+-transporting ATPase
MICCRKVHDEFNIFENIHTNPMFIVLWFVICGGQFVIAQYGGYVFQVCLEGLDGPQWGISILIGLSTFVVNAILKCLPDWIAPALGDDRVFNERYPKHARKLADLE